MPLASDSSFLHGTLASESSMVYPDSSVRPGLDLQVHYVGNRQVLNVMVRSLLTQDTDMRYRLIGFRSK